MKLHPGVRLVLATLAVLLLLALTFEGITGGVRQLPQSDTPGQIAQSVAQLLYGVFALLVIATAIRWREFATIVQLAFVASCVVAASLAAIVWGATSILEGALTGCAALVVALLLVWLLRVTLVPLMQER
jgi:hypothetical protein